MKYILNSLKGHMNRKEKSGSMRHKSAILVNSNLRRLLWLVWWKPYNYHLSTSKIFPRVFRKRFLTLDQAARNKKFWLESLTTETAQSLVVLLLKQEERTENLICLLKKTIPLKYWGYLEATKHLHAALLLLSSGITCKWFHNSIQHCYYR